MAKQELFSELLETTANACACFVDAEIKVGDGELAESQKYVKKGQILMKALLTDTFKEMEEGFGLNVQETNDYDYPNNMELIKSLAQICAHLGSYLGTNESLVQNITLKNLFKAINTAKEIYLALYEN